MKLKLINLALLSVFVVACASNKKDAQSNEANLVDDYVTSGQYTTIDFEEGSSDIDEFDKIAMERLLKRISHLPREASEIKVLAWGDHETDQSINRKAQTRDILLANERANITKEFLREDLSTPVKVSLFNMAKKPDLFDKLTNNENFFIKQNIAQNGVTATRLPTGETSYTKARKVLVIINLKN